MKNISYDQIISLLLLEDDWGYKEGEPAPSKGAIATALKIAHILESSPYYSSVLKIQDLSADAIGGVAFDLCIKWHKEMCDIDIDEWQQMNPRYASIEIRNDVGLDRHPVLLLCDRKTKYVSAKSFESLDEDELHVQFSTAIEFLMNR